MVKVTKSHRGQNESLRIRCYIYINELFEKYKLTKHKVFEELCEGEYASRRERGREEGRKE